MYLSANTFAVSGLRVFEGSISPVKVTENVSRATCFKFRANSDNMAMTDVSAAPQLWYIENMQKCMEETEQQIMYQLEWQVQHWPSLCLVIEQTCRQKPTLWSIKRCLLI